MSDKELFLEVGSKVRKLRFNAGFVSHEKFAEHHQINRITYWRLESGKNCTLKSLNKILQIHQLTLKEFINL